MNGSLSASYNGGTYSVTASTAVDYRQQTDTQQIEKNSVGHSLAITRNASARTKKDHKISFRVLESTAFGVVQRFNEFDLRFRRRPYGGAWDGILFWGRLTHSRVLGILANPSYATPMCSGDTNRPITDCRFVLLPPRCSSGIPRWGDGFIRAICQD